MVYLPLCELEPGTVLFEDDGENGEGQWTMSGLWNLSADSGCADPDHISPTHAFYFGLPERCDMYDYGMHGSVALGHLTTMPVAGVGDGTTLTFYSYRDQGPYDKIRLEIAPAGVDNWTQVWVEKVIWWLIGDRTALTHVFQGPF